MLERLFSTVVTSKNIGTRLPCLDSHPHHLAVNPSRVLWGSTGMGDRPFCPLLLRGNIPASRSFPEFQRADSVANQGKENQETTRGKSRSQRSSSRLGDPSTPFLVAQLVKNPPAMWETWVWSLSWEDLPEEGMATHSSILAWRIPMDRKAWQATVHEVV